EDTPLLAVPTQPAVDEPAPAVHAAVEPRWLQNRIGCGVVGGYVSVGCALVCGGAAGTPVVWGLRRTRCGIGRAGPHPVGTCARRSPRRGSRAVRDECPRGRNDRLRAAAVLRTGAGERAGSTGSRAGQVRAVAAERPTR